jgi:hypothetical protein
MQEFLIFSVAYLAGIASKIIWENMTKNKKSSPEDVTNSYAEPVELEDGKFAIPKPDDEFMEGVEYDEIRTEINPKQDEQEILARPPDPKGKPTIRPV